MEKKDLSEIIAHEIKLWESRVFFPNERFRENTPADLDLLKKRVIDANINDETLILASETEACIYKIGRFLIEIGVKNKNMTFLDGDLFLPYIDTESKYLWQARNLIDEAVQNVSKDIARKWVIIPEINFEWTKELAIYFITKVKEHNPYGIIFFSNKNCHANLAQVLVEETYIDVFQFPKPRYSPKKEKALPPDEY